MSHSLSDAVPLQFRKRSIALEDGFMKQDDNQYVMSTGNDVHDSKGASVDEMRFPYPSSEASDDTHTGGTFKRETALTKYYKPIDSYEGAHRYDPEFQWEANEEERLVRKIDLKIMAWCCFTFFSLQLDRGNIVQAVSDDMLTDLNINTNDYNNGQMVFYLSFLCAELPSQAIGKRLGPDTWIPCQMVLWSLVAACQALMSGRASYYICRALLGLFEGGFVPDTVLYLSYFYTSVELPKRLSFFWTTYEFTAIVSAFLAYGILHLGGVHGLYGWRWLFAIEGILTGCIGIASYFYLPPSPTQTASKVRGKAGWFSEREEKIMVNRVLRDDPSKGDMYNRQPLSFGLLWSALKDKDMWPIYLIGLSWNIPVIPLTSYLTLTLKSLDFTTFETNLLTIPAYVIFIINLIFWTWLSEKVNERLIMTLVAQLWNLPLLIALEVLPKPTTDGAKWAHYALTIMLVGSPYIHAILVALTSRNAGTVRTRTVASALYNMSVQMANIIASQIYRNNDKPLYRAGNKALLGIVAWNVIITVAAKFYYKSRNASRANVWDAMTREEKDNYLSTTKDEGNRRLDFRFAN